MHCTGKPADSQYVGSTTITSSRDEAEGRWLPSSTAQYTDNTSPGAGCRFTCDTEFKRDNGSCINAGPLVGISHDTVNGTITVHDGTNTYTIQNKNVGAAKIGTGLITGGDGCNSITDCIDGSAGYYFQRGNIYGFPSTGTVTSNGSLV
jgi:hypothetical protein